MSIKNCKYFETALGYEGHQIYIFIELVTTEWQDNLMLVIGASEGRAAPNIV